MRWRPADLSHPGALLLGLVLACGVAVIGGSRISEHMQENRAVAEALTHGNPDRAPMLLIRYGCAGCHTISGVPGADGKVGPDLTGLRARVYIAGVARNDGDMLVRWIVDPPSIVPRTAMPKTGIDERDARDVAAFLYMQ